MLRINQTIISYSEFFHKAWYVASTISKHCRPLVGEQASKYHCTVKELLDCSFYPVRFVNPSRNIFVPYNDPEAQPIRFAEAMQREDLKEELLKKYDRSRPPIETAQLIVLRCETCNRHVIIDGNHRLCWLICEMKMDAVLEVWELSGISWPEDTPDMSVVCSCNGRV